MTQTFHAHCFLSARLQQGGMNWKRSKIDASNVRFKYLHVFFKKRNVSWFNSFYNIEKLAKKTCWSWAIWNDIGLKKNGISTLLFSIQKKKIERNEIWTMNRRFFATFSVKFFAPCLEITVIHIRIIKRLHKTRKKPQQIMFQSMNAQEHKHLEIHNCVQHQHWTHRARECTVNIKRKKYDSLD